MNNLFQTLGLGWYMAVRGIKRTSFLSKAFIIFIMMLTFLNLLVVRGVLVGIPDSSLENARFNETGDVLVSRSDGEQEIGKTFEITQYLDNSPYVAGYSTRYQGSAVIESNYKISKKDGENTSKRNVPLKGIDPLSEESITGISQFIIEGRFLNPRETGSIVIGSGLLAGEDSPNFTGEDLLENVQVNTPVLVSINGNTKEYLVVGIISSKGQIDNTAYVIDTELRSLLGKTNTNASEIAIRTITPRLDSVLVADLRDQTFSEEGKFETSLQAAGEFLTDIKTIFDFLSGFIGIIGIIISAITIFIIIFVNAVSRKQEIGITKAVGISQSSIIISYFIQSIFYTFFGILSAIAVFFILLVPYFRANPVDFPFTDVYLSVDPVAIGIQALMLFVAGGLAGYIPAKMIIKQNVLSLILGR